YCITPKYLCDYFYKIHKEIYDWFNFSYDNFSRTSKNIHHKTAQEFFLVLYKKGYLIEDYLKLPYCKNCNRQLSDRFIEGTCPNCKNDSARGDQCEKCGNVLDPINLIEPRCAVCKSKEIEFKDTKHLFFDLPKLSNKLEKWIKSNKHWREQVRNMALAWIKEGLKPRCVTRNLEWGIKVPIKGYEDLVFYVWSEATIGYISSTKEWNLNKWRDYWQKKDSKIYHFIGKDNIAFHTILFPAELIAHGNFNLPYNVVGLQYLNFEGQKFSKSKGIGVFCENLPNSGLDPDYWRFYLTFLIPENKDTDFSWKDFQNRINSDLIGNFSNFINRTLKFIWNKFNGEIPKGKLDNNFVDEVKKRINDILKFYENVELREALQEILKLSDFGNKYFDSKKPWENNDKDTIFLCANLCKILGLLIRPILPDTSKRILETLNCKDADWKGLNKFDLKGKIKEPKILFNKMEDKVIEGLKVKTSKVTDYFKKV
ncbi:MAG: methionine--tRNA ligase, partial [Nanoarchaeota archaeon]